MRPGSRHGIDRETYRAEARFYALRGNDLPHAVLTPSLVREIRSRTKSGGYTKTARQWAQEIGCSIPTIERCRAFETWGHVA